MPKKRVKRPAPGTLPSPVPSPSPPPSTNDKPRNYGDRGMKKKVAKRKGTQISKAFAKQKKGMSTTPPAAVSRAKAKKAFTGSSKNFQKAFTAYKRTVKKRNKRATTRKGY